MSRHSTNLLMWDDLRAPASGINPAGTASPPDEDTTNGGLLFGSVSDEIVAIQIQFPHGWAEGTVIVPHVHWMKTTSASGTVCWKMEYKWAPIGEVMDAAFTSLSVTSTVDGTPDTDTANKHLISSFGEVSTTGKQISDMMLIRLSRDVSEDTYGADARLLEFDIHYQINAFGSEHQWEREDNR